MCSLFGGKKTENRARYEKVRRHIYFSGRVQGVGFRYRAVQAAIDYHLTGWVQNLSDGRVEMEVQGEEETITTMISRLRAGTFVAIDSMTQAEVPLREDEREFRITG